MVDIANSVSSFQNHYTHFPRSSPLPRYSYERHERGKPGTHHSNALPDIGSGGKKGYFGRGGKKWYFHFSGFKGF